MKFGIIKERKNPPDKRVVLPPDAIAKFKQQYPNVTVFVESSEIRIFSDDEYKNMGITVTEDVSDCDILFGVKEVPVANLIPNKSYFFFSHTLKKQPYNRDLLRAILEKNITLYDHETIVNEQHRRLIGFGHYAGIVGTYNAIRAFGVKFELYKLPKAETLDGKEGIIKQLKRITLPPIKFVVTGTGKVAGGVKEILDSIKVKEISKENFLSKKYAQAVYTQLDALDYNIRKDEQQLDFNDFNANPDAYTSSFEPYSKVADIYITAHFHAPLAPPILTQEMLQSRDCNIRIVADISCDVNGPIACTLRSSTIAEPLYGYLPSENKEVDVFHPAAVVVMAVDNLPCEVPKDASIGFGEQFLEHVIPAFFNSDKDKVLARAKMTENGKLTSNFSYLKDYIDGTNLS